MTVVGAGIVGLAIARELSAHAEVTVLDKEERVAAHQTSHNSGVAHAGVYYPPGSLKAALCRQGIELLKAYCVERTLPFEESGKLIVARDGSELGRLEEIECRGRANGVPDLQRLDGDQMREVEPHVAGVAALHSPHTAIVDFTAVAAALADDVRRAGGTIRLGFEVAGVERRAPEIWLRSAAGEAVACERAVLCPGLQADRLARLAGEQDGPVIVPFRGEYHRLIRGREGLVRGLIYPVPDPAYPFLGVHFTRRVGGGVDIGPNAVLALAREGYRWSDVSLRDTAETLAWPGFRRLARRHWRAGVAEFRGSLSRRAFVTQARELIPELSVDDVEPAAAGVRAQAVDRDGALVDDFRIGEARGVVSVRNAPSPAATSALAIAQHLRERILSSQVS